ncbi:MAG: VacJ family lipoprotein [Planctomycetes bacterium B3_Pla]|nr:MAG: VacJ family lipoprotein [Planctomycetes bacterium B3_Pla]
MYMVLKGIQAFVMKYHTKLLILILIVIAGTICGCANSAQNAPPMQAVDFTGVSAEEFDNEDFDLLEEEYAEQMVGIPDPLEPFNRFMFNINDTLYFWAVKPVSEVYAGVVPEPARIGIDNFFDNLSTPARYINCLLQGKGEGADTELRRFAINTTCGILGFGDPALDQYGLEPVYEDLGQTLAVYGFGDGFYLVLPLFGPSNARDSIGRLGDSFLNPVSYVEPTETSYGISAVQFTNSNSLCLGEYESFKSITVEPYIAMRESYVQYRNKQIQE